VKILYIVTLAERGGAQVHLLGLLRGFLKSHQQVLCAGESGFLTEAASRLGIACHVVPSLVRRLNPMRDVPAVAEVAALVRREKPDLIHAHTAKAGFVGRLAGRITGCPVVFTPHGWSFSGRGGPWQRSVALPLERLAARWSARTIVVSGAERDLAQAAHLGSALTVIHNGLEESSYRASPGSKVIPQLVMVARFSAPKDHLTLLEALARLASPYRCLLVGDGPLRGEAERAATRLGLDRSVRFCGTRSDVAELLSECHLFVLSSRSEAFPMSILEAMRAGLPVIASDVGGIPEAVVDGVTGYLCPAADSGALSRQLEVLFREPEIRQRFGRAGHDRFLAHFTGIKMLQQTESVYESLVQARPAARVMTA